MCASLKAQRLFPTVAREQAVLTVLSAVRDESAPMGWRGLDEIRCGDVRDPSAEQLRWLVPQCRMNAATHRDVPLVIVCGANEPVSVSARS